MERDGRLWAELLETRRLSPSVRQLSLAPAEPLSYQAGQWVNVWLDVEGQPCKRAYSIANAPRADGVIELAITHVDGGRVSPHLHALQPGARVGLDGPHGFFVRDEAARARPALFVGTGTGLAPLRAMLEAEADAPSAPRVLLFGCRTPDDVLWPEEQAAWAAGGIDVEVTLSRPPEGWTGATGYVQTHVERLARALGEPDVYICGLSHMVKAVRSVLKQQLGYDRKRIHSERYD